MSIKRETIADTFALITFGLVIGMAVEIFVAGLSIDQSLQSRMLSIPTNLLIARPYGLFRDWVLRFGDGGQVRNAALDIIAFLGFQMPVYALLVASTGASVDQIITACVGQIGALIIMGRPYGIYMQMCRNWFVHGALRTA
ncbi:MAG: L-alanine exporter AlaE [Endozoicomonas sp.]